MIQFNELPEGCKANILSLTTPRDACRLSLISPAFKSAADSDALWERFLPSNYQTILSRATNSSTLSFSSKKELYFNLCHNPILIDDGKKSFQMDKWSGKKSYMLSARDLVIAWWDNTSFWSWVSLPESRFAEVAELQFVWWLEIHGKINASVLSPMTSYKAYIVFKMKKEAFGFDQCPAVVSVAVVGCEGCSGNVCLDFHTNEMQELARPKKRSDGWYEIELGEFFIEDKDDDELDLCLKEVKGGDTKGGLIVYGIEVRPKEAS